MREPHQDTLRTNSPNPLMTRATLSYDFVFHSDISPYVDDPPPEPEAFLAFYTFDYIHKKAKCLVSLLVKFIHPDTLDLDLEEVAEEVYIHLWQTLEDKEREPILHLEAYLGRMIRNKFYDEIRKRKRPDSPQSPQLLSMLADRMVLEDKALLSPSSGMSDPALEYERKQRDAQILHRYAYAVSKLPMRQKLAMTCELLEKADNLAWMTDALTIYGVDTQVQWPTDKKAKQRLQASLPPARKAIAKRLNIDIPVFIERKQRSRK